MFFVSRKSKCRKDSESTSFFCSFFSYFFTPPCPYHSSPYSFLYFPPFFAALRAPVLSQRSYISVQSPVSTSKSVKSLHSDVLFRPQSDKRLPLPRWLILHIPSSEAASSVCCREQFSPLHRSTLARELLNSPLSALLSLSFGYSG